ncbi:YciI family protein [Amycolatopsis palatopharyngis]|uniref:YciI family protein n=1 Tax=Amycolatopsis palatopharyngis TaxID=187982 RepID=UPI000E234E98|nr:YciI family protein [Amycolatopsis palatopharyngis]
MKYLLLIYSNPARWEHPMFLHQHETLPAEERDARMNEFTALFTEITESGEFIDSAPLADPINSKTVRVRDKGLAITDGPFVDAKEHLAGYFVIDCETPERATEIASRFPDARDCAVEVRPIMEIAGMEM